MGRETNLSNNSNLRRTLSRLKRTLKVRKLRKRKVNFRSSNKTAWIGMPLVRKLRQPSINVTRMATPPTSRITREALAKVPRMGLSLPISMLLVAPLKRDSNNYLWDETTKSRQLITVKLRRKMTKNLKRNPRKRRNKRATQTSWKSPLRMTKKSNLAPQNTAVMKNPTMSSEDATFASRTSIVQVLTPLTHIHFNQINFSFRFTKSSTKLLQV